MFALLPIDAAPSLTPFSHSYHYRSAILFGFATVVQDHGEKLWAMELITNSVVPGRWENVRTPPDGGEMSSTTILKVRIASGSGKITDGPPHDEKKDLTREEIVTKVWTGVIPVYESLGPPIASETNRVGEVPEHIRSYIEESNKRGKSYPAEHAGEK
ncbi:MAG: hypothetical protein Q9190_002017 [Brigantiaea leucoxantha]